MTIEFGLFADKLSEQLKPFDIPKEKTDEWQHIADFLMVAHLSKKLTDREQRKLYDFLIEDIKKEIIGGKSK